jgi:3-dehydroquinate synthase
MSGFAIDFPGRPSRRCLVEFGRGLFSRAAGWLAKELAPHRLAVVADGNVAGLYGKLLLEEMAREGVEAVLVTFPPGEEHKSFRTLGGVLERLAAEKIGRDGSVAALGGGITGDIAGLAAALHCRGLSWVQMPTTTLSMADSALGGKTAVNIGGAKNMAGAFHQPAAVFADADTLVTLPLRHLRAGLAEVVKTALVADAGLFERTEEAADRLCDPSSPQLEEVLYRSAALKAAIVSRDERESGEREILNAGHTIGHALEAAAGGRLLHGEAVAVGLVLETRLAVRAVGFPEAARRRILSLLERLGLPTSIPKAIDSGAVVEMLASDKKVREGRLRLSLPRDIGVFERPTHGIGWAMEIGIGDLRLVL